MNRPASERTAAPSLDIFSRALLAMIAILLGVIALRPYILPEPVFAAARLQYKVETSPMRSPTEMEHAMNRWGAQGWTLLTSDDGILIFQKPATSTTRAVPSPTPEEDPR